MEELTKIIDGIHTEKKQSKERREIIKNEYLRLIENLHKRRGKKAVYNKYLKTEVQIIMRESEKKQ